MAGATPWYRDSRFERQGAWARGQRAGLRSAANANRARAAWGRATAGE